MNNVETKEKRNWSFSKISNFFFREDNISARRKIFNSLWAIFFGLVISSIFISILGANPIQVFSRMITRSFNSFSINRTLLTITVFIFASVGVGMGFKSGLFNIGIPGQMMMSGILSLMIIISLDSTSPGILMLAVLVGSLASMIVGVIAGILKAYLGINEVITTILLNWIIYYLCYYVLRDGSSPFTSEITSVGNSKIISLNPFYSKAAFAAILLVVGIIFSFGMWFVLKRTTLGYKIKMNGINKDAAKYSGSNEKLLTIGILGFSGFLAGIAGFIWFIFIKKSMIMETSPLPEGFDSIAISLLAYNSPIGIIFTSTLYSTLSVGATSLQSINYNLDSTTTQIIIGLIIYLAAISVVFAKFRPISKTIKFVLLRSSSHFYKDFSVSKQEKKINKLIAKIEKLQSKENKETQIQQLVAKKQFLENEIFEYEKTKTSLGEFKNHYLKMNAKFKEDLAANASNFENKNDIQKLEKDLLILSKYIKEIEKVSISDKLSTSKVYWLIKKLEFKKYKNSKAILKLKNKPNEARWKELKKSLKEDFYSKASKDLDANQKLELFKEISDKRKEINKELLELGFNDEKFLKEQFKADKKQRQSIYLKDKNEVVSNELITRSWIRMEVQ